jgi:hypothetical protein
MKSAKTRKCKYCCTKKPIDECVNVQMKWFCDFDHAAKYALNKAQANREREYKKQTKVLKQKIKSRSEWLAELQALFNKYVRLRDQYDGCISCDKPLTWKGQWHASHYHPRGRSSFLRFNLWNVHKSCSVCNSHLSGNLANYRPRLIEKIGQDKFDYLEVHQNDLKAWDIDYIKRAIKVCKRGIKRLEKRR